ncbi:MAG: HPr(Ser) kinase/phosphatase [Clostridia bacterium]|nr:HPr(Ser) kinase/phosphatase [Clostridia bacterium]
MANQYSVSLQNIIKEFSLEVVCGQDIIESTAVELSDINRPGLQFAGYYEYFDSRRIQLLGLSEITYVQELNSQEQAERVEAFFSQKPIAVIVARSLDLPDIFVEMAQKYQVALLRTAADTSSFSAALISFLKVRLAPRITRHGVLVEVYGEGVLMLGESGAGKSETAIELIKRGHRLIADDAVEIRRVSDKTLVGTAPENIRHFIELRGIGIINARRIFGIGSVKMTEKIDMVVNLENWDPDKVYDRMGITNETTTILDLQVPSVTIPVKPGRNLAVIIEVAAMNNRQKKMGYNAAQELLNRLGMDSGVPVTEEEKSIWSSF